MPENKQSSTFHSRNYHKGRYDLKALVDSNPALSTYLVKLHGKETVQFSDPSAIKELNKAILIKDYKLSYWDIPEGFLCPSVPGRAEYLHHLTDLLASFNKGKIPRGPEFICLDIGIGANCIYPIVGRKAYGWSFVGSDTNKTALVSASKIISSNELLAENVTLRHQENPSQIIKGIMQANEYCDVSICNPPFHTSQEEAAHANKKKNRGLARNKTVTRTKETNKNFGGQHSELWYPGGEFAFVRKMIIESQAARTNCFLFSSLISQKKNIPKLQATLASCGAKFHTEIQIQHGNKISRLLAWSFLTDKQIKVWTKTRWS